MLYFKARHQLIEKEQEIMRLKQIMGNKTVTSVDKSILSYFLN